MNDITMETRDGSIEITEIELPPTIHIQSRAPLWRRLWFLVSAVPRYLISGSVEVP